MANLSRDTLFNNRKEKMTPVQKELYDLMAAINHFINCALRGHRELSTGKGLSMLYSDFLLSLADEFKKTMQARGDCCLKGEGETKEEIAVFDDFFRIAEFAFPAIKTIIQNPSRQIKKVEVKLPAARVAAFTGRTMQWMAKRPGRTVAEKISPENKIMTTRTVFSVDTKENRELMYLYKNLYNIITSRLNGTRCEKCNNHDICGREWVADMQKMIAAYSRLKTDELGEIKAEKQATQNNKLMCDLQYKIVWDAVVMLSRVEEDIEQQFERVKNRFAQLLYWLVLASALTDRRANIYDYVGKVTDENGELTFKNVDHTFSQVIDTVIFANENAEFQYSLQFNCNGGRIWVNRLGLQGEQDCVFDMDVFDFFTSAGLDGQEQVK